MKRYAPVPKEAAFAALMNHLFFLKGEQEGSGVSERFDFQRNFSSPKSTKQLDKGTGWNDEISVEVISANTDDYILSVIVTRLLVDDFQFNEVTNPLSVQNIVWIPPQN